MILNNLNNQKEQYSFTDFYNEISGKTEFSTETGIVVEYNSTSDIALKTGMSVNSAITITCTGTSDDDFILFRGNSEARAFMLNKNADMSLTNFFCAYGSFTSNVPSSDYSQEGGGMIFNKGKITLENGTFLSNKVSANSSCTLDGGGAIYNPQGNLNITSVSFISNQSQCDGGAIFNGSYEGSPTFIATATISQSTFSNNIANYRGGAVMNMSGELNLQNNLFDGNKSVCDSSETPGESEGMGGAIYSSSLPENESNDSFGFLLSGNTFTNNYAQLKGGAIYSDNESMSSKGDTFLNNSSDNGGAIYLNSPDESDHSIIDNCTFIANTATMDGGALYIANGSVTISNSTFQGNSASSSGNGGAIYIDKEDDQKATRITIQDCRFSSESDTIFINSGNVTFSGTNFVSGNINGEFSLESDATIVMDISSYTQANTTPIIERGNYMTNSGSLAVNLNVNQAKESGIDYCLVKGGISHNKIQLWLDGVYTGHTINTPTSSPMTEVAFGNGRYTLKYNESNNDYTITATKKEDRSFSDVSLDIGTYTGELPLFGTFKRTETEDDASGIVISHDTKITGHDFNDQKLTFDGQNKTNSASFVLNTGNVRFELANAVIKNSGEKGAIDAKIGTVVLKDMTFETISDTIRAQNLELAGDISIAGQMESDNYVIVNEGTSLNMDLSVHNPYTPNSAPLFFCEYGKMFRKQDGESENHLTLSVNVSDVQKSGSYFIADNASNFQKTITLTGAVSGEISTSKSIQSSGRSYTLNVDKDNNLFLNIFENDFTNLQNQLDNILGDTLVLSTDYLASDNDTKGIHLQHPVNIKGENHVLDAKGKDFLLINADGNSSGVVISIEDITLKNGKNDQAGAILSTAEKLTLKNVIFDGNTVINPSSDNVGGAICNRSRLDLQGNITFLTESDTFCSTGTSAAVYLDNATISLASQIRAGRAFEFVDNNLSELIFDITNHSVVSDETPQPMIVDYNTVFANATDTNFKLSLNISNDLQQPGLYYLASNADFIKNTSVEIFVNNVSTEKTLSSGTGPVSVGENVLLLSLEEGTESADLVLSVMYSFSSLQNQINATQAGNTLTLTGDYMNMDDTALAITQNAIEIDGKSSTWYSLDKIIDGNSKSRIFEIEKSGTKLSHLIIQNGLVKGSDGGAIYNTADELTLEDIVFNNNRASTNDKHEGGNGGALYNAEEKTVYLKNSSFETQNDTIFNEGKIILSGTVCFAGNVAGNGSYEVAENTKLVFDLSSYETSNKTAIISDLDAIVGTPSYAVNIAFGLNAGDYILANNAESFSSSITVISGFSEEKTLLLNEVQEINDSNYMLTKTNNNDLILSVYPAKNGVYGQKNGEDEKELENPAKNIKISSLHEYDTLLVYSGGCAVNTTVSDGGTLYVRSFGKAKKVTVKNGCFDVSASGYASDVLLKSGTASISGKVTNLTAEDGSLNIISGAEIDVLNANEKVKIDYVDSSKLEELYLTVIFDLTGTVFGSAGSLDSDYTNINININKKLYRGKDNITFTAFSAADNIQTLTINGSLAEIGKNNGYTQDLAFKAEYKDGNLSISGNGVVQYKDSKLDIQNETDISAKDYEGLKSITIRKGTNDKPITLTASNLRTANGKTTVTLKDYTKLSASSLLKDPDEGGTNILVMGKNSELELLSEEGSASINGLQKMTVGNDCKLTLKNKLLGQAGNGTISIGKTTTADFYNDIDLITGKNTFTIGSCSTIKVYKNISNITSLKLANGSSEKITSMTVNGVYTPSLAVSTSIALGKYTSLTIKNENDNSIALDNGDPSLLTSMKITVGSFSTFTAYGDVKGISNLSLSAGSASIHTKMILKKSEDQLYSLYGTSGKDTIKLSSYAELEANELNLYGGKNSFSISVDSKANFKSGVSNLQKITLTSGKNTDHIADFSVGEDLILSNLTDTISVGKFGKFIVKGNISTKKSAGGEIKLSINSNAVFNAKQLSEITSISVSSTTNYKDDKKIVHSGTDYQEFWVTGITATDRNNTFSFGNSVNAKIGGEIDFKSGKDTLKVGNLSKLTITGDLKFGKGTTKDYGILSIGAQARFIVGGDISGINKLSVASGKKNNVYTHVEMTSLSGSTGNDTITFGKFSDTAIRGDLDLMDAAKQDKISVANDSCLGIAGDIINYDVLSIQLGSNSKLGLNENMYNLYKDNVLDITTGKDAKVYNLGTASQAEAFRGFMEELTDNSNCDTFSKLGDYDNGWLSNTDNDYTDTCDYVALDAVNFSSCTIHSEAGKIKVTIFKKDATGQWDSGKLIDEGTGSRTGTWLIEGLEDYTSDTCRIKVELDSNVEDGIYTYQITLA